MDLIELHILQSFPVTCLNRDDVGAPKTAMFGGALRARVSSQCWKRAIRAQAQELQPASFAGTRSRYIVDKLAAQFEQGGQPTEVAGILAERTADAVGKLDDKNSGNVKTLLYFSPSELAAVASAVLEAGSAELAAQLVAKPADKKATKELDALTKKAAKGFATKVKDAADIAIFGRMVADDHSLTVEGAGMFSHALSTHKTSNEVDFFSAVDDLKPVDSDDAGAGHIGTNEFNSACYYRCIALNLDLLLAGHGDQPGYLAHLSPEEQRTVLDAFLRAAILAVPEARKNAMFGMNPPCFVLGLRRRGQPLSLVNAFEKPIRARNGYIEPSIEALKEHYTTLSAAYGLEASAQAILPEVALDAFVAALVDGGTDA
jgi:CRISPR system Cascade subunit CasC